MEITLRYTIDGRENITKYGMIDVDKILNILHVKTYKGIYGALRRIRQKLPDKRSDILWIVRWLDKHKVEYIHAE